MNVGQILETHLGWACAGLGLKIGQAVDAYNAKHDIEPLKDMLEEDLRRRRDHQVARARTNSSSSAPTCSHGVPIATPVFDGAKEADIENMLDMAGLDHSGQVDGLRRPHRRAVRSQGDGGLHLHAQAAPPRGRQDPRALDRSVLARHPAAAGRQGAVRRPALRRNGGLGARSLRRRLHAAGNADGEVGRRRRPHQGLRGDRARRRHVRGRHPRKLQRAGQGNALARPQRRPAQFQAGAAASRRKRPSNFDDCGTARAPSREPHDLRTTGRRTVRQRPTRSARRRR